jgi:hypothetical protein
MPDLPDHIEVIAKTPGLPYDEIDIVVSLPTFKRPEHLIRTLDTLNAQTTKRKWAVVVIENETEKKEGATVAAPLFEAGKYRGMLIGESHRGNCNAYNATTLASLAVHSIRFLKSQIRNSGQSTRSSCRTIPRQVRFRSSTLRAIC